MDRVPRRRRAKRAWALFASAASALAIAGALGPLACGDLGVPAFEDSDGDIQFDTSIVTPEMVDASDGGEAATTTLHGSVLDPTGKPIAGALVAIEVGGLNLMNPGASLPDGGTGPTLKIDPFYRLGALADDAGAFTLQVPEESLGVHAYAPGFLCGVPDAGAIEGDAGSVVVRPLPLPDVDGAPPALPRVTEFTIAPGMAYPGQPVTLTAVVVAPEPRTDPLSEQVLAIEPSSGWAGVFAPPTPGTPGVGYPNGVYARLVPAPMTPGVYKFYMLAATEACVVSAPVTATLLVTESGEGGLDATEEVEEDAPTDGSKAEAASD